MLLLPTFCFDLGIKHIFCGIGVRFQEAMGHYMQDFVTRMKEIKASLGGEESIEDKEALLDELMEIVENIDYARGEFISKLFIVPGPQ